MKTKQAFTVEHIFFATVPPYNEEKKYKNKALKYRVIASPGDTANYLFEIFDRATDDCKVEILFKSDQNQHNPIRSKLLDLIYAKSIVEKERIFKELARAMYDITDARNGMGLFVLIEGKKRTETRLMLCRFKGAQGLHNEGDDLKYLSQVFTKQNKHYKLAVFQDILSAKSFWKGYAIDKQTAANDYKPFSYFWIEQFLQAETALTSKQGTSQFSKIIKNVLKSTSSLDDKQQIISGILNLKSKPGVKMSVKQFTDQYLSDDLAKIFIAETKNDDFFNAEFAIDADVFQEELGSTVILLEDGITAFIPTFNYKKHVTEENIRKGTKVKIEGLLKDKKINNRKDKENHQNEEIDKKA